MMVFSIWKKAIARCTVYVESSSMFYNKSCFCSLTVRQNASTMWFATRAFSSCGRKGSDSENNADEVKTLLKECGFDDAHLLIDARRREALKPDNVLPKLKFFSSIGIDLPKNVLRWPLFLPSSLETIILCYDYLRAMPMTQDDFNRMLKTRPDILLTNVKTCLSPNVELLKGMGVPMSSIRFLATRCTSTISRKHWKVKAHLQQLIAMGMDPQKKTFILALHVMCARNKKSWDHQFRLFNGFGLSDDEIISAFKKQPLIMALSEKNLMNTVGFFLNELHWAPSAVFQNPSLLLLSLEKRIMPRCHLMEILLKKGLVKKFSYTYVLSLNEEKFLSKYCYSFKDDFPEVVEIYGLKRCISTV